MAVTTKLNKRKTVLSLCLIRTETARKKLIQFSKPTISKAKHGKSNGKVQILTPLGNNTKKAETNLTAENKACYTTKRKPQA